VTHPRIASPARPGAAATALAAALLCAIAAPAAAGAHWNLGVNVRLPGLVIAGGPYWRYPHRGVFVAVDPFFPFYGAPGWGTPWGPAWVEPPYPARQPYAQALVAPAEPAPPPSGPDPVITPRNGQGGPQAEADRQACNRLATRSLAALRDAQVFQQQVASCLDERGYTMK